MSNIYPVFDHIISRQEKEKILEQKSKVIWFTGLSGAGKTTLASALEQKLFDKGYLTQILDGDNIRIGINNNLSFSEDDRVENIRRISEVSKLFINCGIITICSFISPTDNIRNIAKEIIGEDDFFEIFVDTPLEICESRDIKGLYAKARSGEIKQFTGISSPFDRPKNPNLIIDTSIQSKEKSVDIILNEIFSIIN